MSDTPVGPWRDPLGRPLIGDGVVPVLAYDPGIFIDDDGTPYIIIGVWDFYIARLGDDMISLAETPRKITIHNPEGPYGPGNPRLRDSSLCYVYYRSHGEMEPVRIEAEGVCLPAVDGFPCHQKNGSQEAT